MEISNPHFRQMVEAAPSGIMLVDAAGKILFANPEAHRQFGYPPAGLLEVGVEKLVPARLKAAHPGHRSDFHKDPKTRPMGAGRDLHGRKMDGAEFPVEISLKPIDSPEGRLILCTIVDISERKRAERALHDSEEKLRQSQKMEAAGRLAGGIAHDYNNILATILLNADVLKDSAAGNPETLREIELIEEAAQRGGALTRQLLAFSRAQVLKFEVLDMNRLIQDLLSMLKRLIGEDVEFLIRVAPDLGKVRADKSQMEQIIMNVVMNAREAMPEGGKLFITTQNLRLTEQESGFDFEVKPGDYAMVVVEDSGIGMTKETLNRIFEPFFTTKEKGTGLGLSTVYGIIKQSDGAIKVYSEPGKGTTFKILLPCAAAFEESGQSAPARDEVIKGRGRILFVEDDSAVRDTITRILQKFGFDVSACSTGDAALAAARDPGQIFRLMISDVIMPGKNGPALYRELLKFRPGLKAIFISGYTDRIVKEYGEVLTEGNFLQKPFTTKQLSEKLKQMLD